MSFYAMTTDGKKICSLDHDDLRDQYPPGSFSCHLCGEPLMYKHGTQISSHFAHFADCKADYEHKPESEEHHAAKAAIRADLLLNNPGAQVDLEVPFPEVRRIADVCMTRNGWPEVHEAQLSAITTETLEKRTADYERAGAQVFWYVAGAANTKTNVDWIERHCKFCGILDMVTL